MAKQLSHAERLKIVMQKPTNGFRQAKHLQQKAQRKQRNVTTKIAPNTIAKTMFRASVVSQKLSSEDSELLGWTSLSREELKKQAREEAMQRQTLERAKQEKIKAEKEAKKLAKKEAEARRKEKIRKEKEEKKKRQEANKKKREAQGLPKAQPLFPVNKRNKKSAKNARKKVRQQKRKKEYTHVTSESKIAATHTAEVAKIKQQNQSKSECCPKIIFVMIIAFAGLITFFFIVANNHKQLMPQSIRDGLQPFLKDTINYIEEIAKPAVRHVALMNEQLKDEERKETDRRRQTNPSHHPDL